MHPAGSPRIAHAPDSTNPTLPELLARLDPFGNPTRAAAPHQAQAPASSDGIFPSELLADRDPFRERVRVSAPAQAPAEASLYAPAPQSRDDIFLPGLLADLDPFTEPVRITVPVQAPAQASAYPPAPASGSGGPDRQPARVAVPAQAPVEATQRPAPPPQRSSEILQDIFGLLDPLSNATRAREPAQAPATASAPAHDQPAVPGPAQALRQPQHSSPAHAPREAHAHAPGPEHHHSHPPGHDPDQAHRRASPAHSPRHEEHHAKSPAHGRSSLPKEAMSPAHHDSHAGEHSGPPREAPHQTNAADPGHAAKEPSPEHDSATHGHAASPHHAETHHASRQAPHSSPDPSGRHHSPEHESATRHHAAKAPSLHHAEYEHRAPEEASHRSSAGRKEAVRSPPPPSGTYISHVYAPAFQGVVQLVLCQPLAIGVCAQTRCSLTELCVHPLTVLIQFLKGQSLCRSLWGGRISPQGCSKGAPARSAQCEHWGVLGQPAERGSQCYRAGECHRDLAAASPGCWGSR